ncbi:hypothetical protein METEAL_33430 [Mesoterricola silvestris]|uniref:Mucoidy inhibitor MuiA family protein n=2 Tax=Mesoterricola silvestris TaxID=2927979 RepID=A0AA48GMQ5_9BACT|nr:hypothetical protein METEAL_33430 [Mesoterricola silvestris]
MRLLWPFFAVACTLGAKESIPVDTAIVSVRVHPNEAWITRRGTFQVSGGGAHRVSIPGLPKGLRFDDLRMGVRGPAGTRLGDLTVREAPLTYQESPEWKRLDHEQDQLAEGLERLKGRRTNLDKAEQLFKEMKAAHQKALQHAMAADALKPQTIQEFSVALEGRRLELARQGASLDAEKATLTEKSALNREAMARLKEKGEANPTVVSAELETAKAGSVEVSVAFRSKDASWSPAYEARLSPDKSKLELVLFAAVKQGTHETWNGVGLELLSQDPSGRLDLPAGVSFPALNFKDGNTPKASMSAPENPAKASSLTTIKVPGNVVVPSGEEQRFRISSLDLAPTFRYLAIPRQGPDVFLMAMVMPPPGFALVGGSPVDMLQGTERLGTLQLEPQAPGEPLRLSYGPVPGLVARFEKVEQHHGEVGDKTKEREWVFKERLEVGSTLGFPVEVEVMDRTIAAGTGSVKVDQAENTTPGWEAVRPGIRSWVLHLEAGGKAEVIQQTRIRGPLVGRLVNVGELALEGN